jgi:hypothetical protein
MLGYAYVGMALAYQKNNKIAINIETTLFDKIIQDLKKEGWRVKKEYYGFDKGIDYDFLVLKKDGNIIEFTWDNYGEG